MKKAILNLGVIITGFGFYSCEKVIDIPLDDADRKVVVEAVFRDEPGANYVVLSKTGSVYDDSNFEKISGATVFITDGSGTSTYLGELPGEPGKYNHPTFAVAPNTNYSLTVYTSTDTFTSASQTFYKPMIDSLTYIEQLGSFGFGTDTTYLVFFNFTDDENAENYYRVRAWVNGAADQNLYVSNDELFNGQVYTQPLFATTVEKGDTVLVELLSIDKANYTYFFTLSSSGGGDPFSPTPSNPVSNMENGALGYFGTYTTDTMTIIMPQ